MSDSTARIRELAASLVSAYLQHTQPRAVLLVGSGATGGADGYSDLDMLLYYDETPAEADLAGARKQVGAERFKGTEWPDEEGYSERYDVGGIQCQLGHAVIAPWEREITRVVDDLDLDRRLVKELMGLFEGRPLHGQALIAEWRERAAYTERLQRAMIEKHWQFFPWWHYQDKLTLRDTTVWRYDVLVQSAYNLVGVVAALNRVYFSTFEFKRVHKFIAGFEVAPANLAERLDALFVADTREATAYLERLVAQTQALVQERFPDIDSAIEWGGQPTPPHSRETPWTV